MDDLIHKTAVNTILLQAEAIAGLVGYVNRDFLKCVDVVSKTKGRVVVSGVGKSAIVAQKITATLNSTGTPCMFMHAGDAIHGDVGMIQREDIVMLLSKSGESPEIKVLVPLIKAFGNTLIGMTGSSASYLAKNCDIFLNTTVRKEACPNNLAPTTSTTAQMVMGDALAICLMTSSGFTGTDFAKLHPGGNLGKRLYLRVKDLISSNAKPFVYIQSDLKEVIFQISGSRLGATVVLSEQNKIEGIITDGDLRRMLEKKDSLQDITAGDILTRYPKMITSDALAVNALELLRTNDISQLIVIDDNLNYTGILHLHDLVREGIV